MSVNVQGQSSRTYTLLDKCILTDEVINSKIGNLEWMLG